LLWVGDLGYLPLYYQNFKEEQKAENEWAKKFNFIDIGLGIDQVYENSSDQQNKFNKWYGFLDEAI
jgi:hypothetical protein